WEKRSEEVGSITEVIEEIADRTNLLGLNAAIQAAQAGPYGSAFGVVASEIRELAEQTRESTGQIDELIKAVRHEMVETVKHVLLVSERATDGVGRSERAAASLRQICQQIGKISVQVRAIAEATGLQTGESREVLRGVELFRQRTQEIRDATFEQVHTGEPISKRGLQMSELAQQIQGVMIEQTEASRRIAEQIEALADLSIPATISDD
ncbi:MAG: methyl-accepting chemotaxis protein, partial [Candidatus Methylomirabilales bacterium]